MPNYEYGVKCNVETFWPIWDNWLSSFRFGRWLLAHWLAWNSDYTNEVYNCGKHRVVRRERANL